MSTTKLPFEKEKENSAATAGPTDGACSIDPSVDEGGKKKRTVGNKIFDWGVYSTVAWAGVSAMSFFTAREAINGNNKHFEWLRTLHKGMTETFSKALRSTVMKEASPEVLKKWSEGSALYMILGFGGTALMPIIKYMEDNRQSLAAKIDKSLGTTPPDMDCIAKEPKQSWTSVLAGRVFSVGTGFLAFCAMGPEVADKASKWFGEKTTKIYKAVRPAADEVKVRRNADMIAFDVFFTVITASLMYGFSRFVAKKKDKDKEQSPQEMLAAKPPVVEQKDEHTKDSPEEEVAPKSKAASMHQHSSYMDKIASEASAEKAHGIV